MSQESWTSWIRPNNGCLSEGICWIPFRASSMLIPCTVYFALNIGVPIVLGGFSVWSGQNTNKTILFVFLSWSLVRDYILISSLFLILTILKRQNITLVRTILPTCTFFSTNFDLFGKLNSNQVGPILIIKFQKWNWTTNVEKTNVQMSKFNVSVGKICSTVQISVNISTGTVRQTWRNCAQRTERLCSIKWSLFFSFPICPEFLT